jgi:hypothetical protein
MKKFIDDLIPLPKVADTLGIPMRSLRRAINNSMLPAIKISGRFFILDSYIPLCLALGRNVLKQPLSESEKKDYDHLLKGDKK